MYGMKEATEYVSLQTFKHSIVQYNNSNQNMKSLPVALEVGIPPIVDGLLALGLDLLFFINCSIL
jgi:hypothetical protein